MGADTELKDKPYLKSCYLRNRKNLTKSLVVAVLFLLSAAAKSASADSINSEALNGVFSSSNSKSSDFSFFPKWIHVMGGFDAEKLYAKADCKDGNPVHCNIEKWKQSVASLKGKGQRDMLEGVNSFVNAFPYIEDPNNYGKDDYWATPEEYFTKSGDCEDFAILKYFTLRQLGVPASSMRIVILTDLNLRLLHAVLAVQVGGQTLILDNQLQRVVSAKSIHHYQPIFSINEEGWWRNQIISSSL